MILVLTRRKKEDKEVQKGKCLDAGCFAKYFIEKSWNMHSECNVILKLATSEGGFP